jgi:cell wall-associated NlpC family hydrolase
VTIDSVAAVQTRIAQIQQLVTSTVAGAGASGASSSSSSSATQSPEFASLLADAMATGTAASDPLSDSSSTSGSASSMVSQLLSQLAGGTSNTSMGLGDTSGLASTLSGLTGAAAPATSMPGLGTTTNLSPTTNPTTQQFLSTALAEQGKPYVYGATAQISDPNPPAFDCSELTKWAAARSGVTIPDGATAQYLDIRDHGDTMTVQQALHTPGALLFHFGHEPKNLGDIPADGHVAISLGDGVHTIEARGHAYGTNVFDNAAGRSFNFAGMIPGMT